jgi:hypothetical protein
MILHLFKNLARNGPGAGTTGTTGTGTSRPNGKGADDIYYTDYGFALEWQEEGDKEAAYERRYTWNERNLMASSKDRRYTVHYPVRGGRGAGFPCPL